MEASIYSERNNMEFPPTLIVKVKKKSGHIRCILKSWKSFLITEASWKGTGINLLNFVPVYSRTFACLLVHPLSSPSRGTSSRGWSEQIILPSARDMGPFSFELPYREAASIYSYAFFRTHWTQLAHNSDVLLSLLLHVVYNHIFHIITVQRN